MDSIVREKFYYIRDEGNNPRATICLLKSEEGRIARGVALCSYLDVISKTEGRNKARGRATKALIRNNNTGRISRSADSRILLLRLSRSSKDPEILDKFGFLSEVNPPLTTFELKIINKPQHEVVI